MAGDRDRAITLLVARLGLRSVAVARLELDDLDWLREADGPRYRTPEGSAAVAG